MAKLSIDFSCRQIKNFPAEVGEDYAGFILFSHFRIEKRVKAIFLDIVPAFCCILMVSVN